MKIGYEAKRAFFNMTGLGNYSRGVIKSMSSLFPQNEYYLYTPKIIPSARMDFTRGHKRITVVTPKTLRFAAIWRSMLVIKDLKIAGIEVYHGLSHEIPVGIAAAGIKSIVTVHDLIFKRYPKYFGFTSRMIYNAKIKYACKHADRIVAVSQQTKDDLVNLMDVPADKIEVIYQNCDDSFRVPQTDIKKGEVRLKYNLPKRFVLNLGTVEERKNLLVLVKALHHLPKDIRLVVVGKDNSAYAQKVKQYISRNQLMGRVLFLPNVSFADLPAIYQLAEIFVYPSRFEGFGIPILEALVSGIPVIAATGSCLEEAGGPNSLYVGPDDDKALADKIQLVWTDKEMQTSMCQKGIEFSKKFDDQVLAGQLMQLYTKVVNHAQ